MDLEQKMIICSPSLKSEYDAYYSLRWQVLRAPWKQAKGSEKDELEDNAVHRMAILDNNVIACGRLHFIDNTTALIRYMAVAEDYMKKGFGTKILASLEDAVKDNNYEIIHLHAREGSVSFYDKRGYQLIKKSHLLFNEIQHYKMQKKL